MLGADFRECRPGQAPEVSKWLTHSDCRDWESPAKREACSQRGRNGMDKSHGIQRIGFTDVLKQPNHIDILRVSLETATRAISSVG